MVMVDTHDATYFQRMEASLGDKQHILNWLVPGSVLDVGAGSGKLSHIMANHGYETYALDASPSSQTRIQQYDNIHGVLGHVDELDSLFPENSFDNVVCSSIMHEVYSYGEASHVPGDLIDVNNALIGFRRLLRPGGRLVIRDGIKPTNWSDSVMVQFLQSDGDDFVRYYADNSPFWSDSFSSWTVNLQQTSPNNWIGNLGSAMEIVYTYTWGPESAIREVQEMYGILTELDYLALLSQHGFTILHHEQYVQSGYVEHLKSKVRIMSSDGTIVWPSSNALLVVESP